MQVRVKGPKGLSVHEDIDAIGVGHISKDLVLVTKAGEVTEVGEWTQIVIDMHPVTTLEPVEINEELAFERFKRAIDLSDT